MIVVSARDTRDIPWHLAVDDNERRHAIDHAIDCIRDLREIDEACNVVHLWCAVVSSGDCRSHDGHVPSALSSAGPDRCTRTRAVLQHTSAQCQLAE